VELCFCFCPDVPFVTYPIFIKILWKRDRTLRIDYREKKLIILDENKPTLTIPGKALQKVCRPPFTSQKLRSLPICYPLHHIPSVQMDTDRSDLTAIHITYLTGNPRTPQAVETIYAESKEVSLPLIGFLRTAFSLP
jgi:hypothetical protein